MAIRSLEPRFRDCTLAPYTGNRLAVIDIGSSMVRMIICETKDAYPHLLVHHKTWTALGKGKKDGNFKLDEKRMAHTLDALQWFLWTAEKMDVEAAICVASSAVREAQNGHVFVQQVKDKLGLDVYVISGEEEAQLAAMGAMAGMPDANGLVLDLGGGSLEISETIGEKRFASFPLGILSLQALSENNPEKAVAIVRKEIRRHKWLKDFRCDDLIVLGSGMRTLARLHMGEQKYPLNVLHDYRIEHEDALDVFGRFISGKIAVRVPGMNSEWRTVLPYRAAVLKGILQEVNAKRVRFGTFGLREGVMFIQCGYEADHQDVLMAYAREWANRSGTGSALAEKRAAWIAQQRPSMDKRLLSVIAMMAECGWREQAAYRGHTLFERVLEGPYVGCSHKERMLIATASYFRHEDSFQKGMKRIVGAVLSLKEQQMAFQIGVLLRLTSYLAPGEEVSLEGIRLEEVKGRIRLSGAWPMLQTLPEPVQSCLDLIESENIKEERENVI